MNIQPFGGFRARFHMIRENRISHAHGFADSESDLDSHNDSDEQFDDYEALINLDEEVV